MKILTIFSIVLWSFFPQGRNASPRGFIILDGDYQVKAQGYTSFPFVVDARFGNVLLKGQITVQGQSNYDIEFCVVNYSQLEHFMNGYATETIYSTGRVKMKQFEVFLTPGQYYLLFNNKYSILTAKQVRAWVVADFSRSQQPSFSAPNKNSFDDDVYATPILKGNQLLGFKNLMPQEIYDECHNSPLTDTGVITEIEYKGEDIVSFTVKRPSGQRKNVYFHIEVIGKPFRGRLYEVISENKKGQDYWLFVWKWRVLECR